MNQLRPTTTFSRFAVWAIVILLGSPTYGQHSTDLKPELNVFLLAGQSNMAGADSEVAVPPGFEQTDADRGTLFTTGPLPEGEQSREYVPWGEVRGHEAKGRLVHGPEVGFARTLHAAGWRNLAIIKVHANFGRDVQDWPWSERGALFDHWTSFADARIAELVARGHTIRVRGFLWHQGIDDAIHGKLASHYERNLSDLISVLRKRYADEHAPFLLARSVNSRIAQPDPNAGDDSPMAVVRRSQVKVGESVPFAAWIDVDDLPNVNTHHFSAESQLVIGKRFGEAFLKFQKHAVEVSPVSGLIRSDEPVAPSIDRQPSDRPFCIGVYLAADNHPQNLQLSRMMADWAGHGINTACMRADIYLNLAPQGFHTLAKQWDIDLVVQPTLGPGPEHRHRMQQLIQRVDSYQDSDAVTAWYAVDEFEGVYDSDRPADTEKVWRELVSAIKDLDPKRNVIVNHDARTGSWGGRFAQLGEDESWCSVFWANHHAADFLRKTMATHRAAYSSDCPPLTFVYGAQSTNKAGSATDYEQHGISGVTLEQLKSVSTREDIADYVLTAHKLGAGGAAFFCYDGYYDFQYYTLVDERGRSVEGKMEGIRDAAQQIARLKGCPEVTLKVEDMTTQKNKLVITAVTASGGQPVEETLVQISFDGGYSWDTVPGFANNGGTVEHSYVPAGRWSMLRARCRVEENWSLWTVWNAFPSAKPRLH